MSDTEVKHTPGPLRAVRATKTSDGGTDFAIVDDRNQVVAEFFERVGPSAWYPAKANADRFVACWTACAGGNPAAVPDLVAAIENWEKEFIKIAAPGMHQESVPLMLSRALAKWREGS